MPIIRESVFPVHANIAPLVERMVDAISADSPVTTATSSIENDDNT